MAKGRPGRKREREFLTDLKASFIERGAYFYKIPDMPHFEGSGFRFDLPKPFDAVGVFAGQTFAIEAKVVTQYKSFTLKDLRPSQIEGLENWAKAGGRAYIFILVWGNTVKEKCTTMKHRLLIYRWEKLRDEKRISRAEMACSRFYQRLNVRRPESNRAAHRYNLDPFLVSLFFEMKV